MTARRSRGPMSKDIRNLCNRAIENLSSDFCNGKISDKEFKEGLITLIDKWEPKCGPIIYQNIGLALRYWIRKRFEDKEDQLWQLADEVNPRIKKDKDHPIGGKNGKGGLIK